MEVGLSPRPDPTPASHIGCGETNSFGTERLTLTATNRVLSRGADCGNRNKANSGLGTEERKVVLEVLSVFHLPDLQDLLRSVVIHNLPASRAHVLGFEFSFRHI